MRKLRKLVPGGDRKEGRGTGVPGGGPSPAERQAQREVQRQVNLWSRAFRRAGRTVLGEDAVPTEGPFDPALGREVNRGIVKLRAQATFAQDISRGVPLEEALLATLRAHFAVHEWHAGRGIIDGLAATPGTERARNLAAAMAAHRRDWFPLAYAELGKVDARDAAAHIAVEAVDTCLHIGDDAALARAREIAGHADAMSLPDLVDVAARFLAVSDLDTARTLVAAAESRGHDDLDEREQRQLDVLPGWLEDQPAPQVSEGAVALGVIDYHQPDQQRASTNVGDYVQTLAMLGNVARFSDVTFTGEDGLGELVTDLQGSVREELRRPGVPGQVHVVPVNRDFSTHDRLPGATWMVAFGWHMHSLFGIRHDFPYHPSVRPLFVSFHVNRPEMLTDQAVAYLREHGPVGCRDWTTVDLLLSAGVDAFFTGCLTTTVSAVFPQRDEVGADADLTALIDVPSAVASKVQGPTEVVTHAGQEFREAGLVEGVHAARELLDRYQRRYAQVVTSRLHSYLPATSLGVTADFRPTNPSDVRFDGLYGMTPDGAAFTAMRDGIRELLAETLGLVVSGAEEQTVYERWRALTADRVAQAKEKLAAAADLSHLGQKDLADILRVVSDETKRYGPHDSVDPETVTDVALALDQNLKVQLGTTLEALTTNASGPLRLWITCRGLDKTYQQWVSDAFPHVPITFLPCDHVEYGEIARMIRHITITTMDRLLLPELLPHLDRVTYVDIDAVVLGDVCELARTDLRGTPLAAKTSVYRAVDVWKKAGNLLEPDVAYELRRVMAARHPFPLGTINAGILVLDLARMRADRFSQTFLPLAARYGLNDQDVLLAYAGADRVELESRWNAWPIMEVLDDPATVHYVGSTKPWLPARAPGQEHWEEYTRRFDARVGAWNEPGEG